MLDLFYQFTHFLKIQESVTIDNNVFRLHYKVNFTSPAAYVFTFGTDHCLHLELNFMTVASLQASVMVLTMATLLVTARQYIGDPIDCMVEVTLMRNDNTLRMPIPMEEFMMRNYDTLKMLSYCTVMSCVLFLGHPWKHHGHVLLDSFHLLYPRKVSTFSPSSP